jgi:hypothetical protein
MRKTILISIILFLVSCGNDYEDTPKQIALFKARETQKFDTLICIATASTGSLDLYYLQGKLTLPSDIKQQLSDSLTRDIKVCGNFPKDLINMTSWNFDPELAFKIVGKTILADTENAVGKVPLFYVTKWTKFYYDYDSWTKRLDSGSYPYRKKMVEDIIEHLKLKGQSIVEVKNILGKPDYVEKNEIGYKIDEENGKNKSQIAKTTLTLKFNQDSIITDVKKNKRK